MRNILIIIVVLGLITILSLLIFVLYFSARTPDTNEVYTSTVTETTAPITSTITSSSTTSTVMQVNPTTTLSSTLVVNVTPEKFYSKDSTSMRLYKGDVGVVSVKDAGGEKLSRVEIFVDGESAGFTDEEGVVLLKDLKPGNYSLGTERVGFEREVMNFSVWKSSYGLSIFVRRKLPDPLRGEYIADGKVNFRFYDLPSCAICRVMRPQVSEIVSENRDCVVYEIVSMWKYAKELSGRFTGMQTPIIEIEGPNRRFQTSGFVPSSKLEDMIVKASPACFKG